MKIVDRYIFRELIGPFFFGIAIFTIILLAYFILPQLTSLYNQAGLSLKDAFLLFIYQLPRYLIYTCAMSALLAVLMGFGRLSAESEMVALHSAGASLPRLSMAGIFFGILVSLLALGLGQYVVSPANIAADNILKKVKSQQIGVRKDISFNESSGDVKRTIIVGTLDPAAGTMQKVIIIESQAANPVAIYYAERAERTQDGKAWRLFDGYTKNLSGNMPDISIKFDEQDIVSPTTPKELAMSGKRNVEMTTQELKDQIALLRRQGNSAALFEVELHRRIALPFAALVFTLIGTPFAMRSPRRSSTMGALGAGVTIMIVFAYFIVSNWLGIMGENGSLNAFAAAWLPNAAFAIVGLVLIFSARK